MGVGHGATAPAMGDVALARAILAAVRAVPGVAGISRGRYAVARTFGLGGETVEGIQITRAPDGLRIEVHVHVRLVPIPPLADALRAAVVAAMAGSGDAIAAVDVWVDGLREDGDDQTEEGTT